MAKYLHLFEDRDAFMDEYTDYDKVMSFECSAGTFTYSNGDWINGSKTLIADYSRNPGVGPYSYVNKTGAYDRDSRSGVTITSVNIEEGEYHEPWVSYTEPKTTTKMTGNMWAIEALDPTSPETVGHVEAEYVGEITYVLPQRYVD